MNDEIKEILNKWKCYIELTKKFTTNEYEMLRVEDIDKILDYITNLQQAIKDTKDTADDMLYELKQENERLKDSRDWWKDRFFGQQEYDDSHRITAIEYKKRIYKAIEYINKHPVNACHNLLNILQGESKGE